MTKLRSGNAFRRALPLGQGLVALLAVHFTPGSEVKEFEAGRRTQSIFEVVSTGTSCTAALSERQKPQLNLSFSIRVPCFDFPFYGRVLKPCGNLSIGHEGLHIQTPFGEKAFPPADAIVEHVEDFHASFSWVTTTLVIVGVAIWLLSMALSERFRAEVRRTWECIKQGKMTEEDPNATPQQIADNGARRLSIESDDFIALGNTYRVLAVLRPDVVGWRGWICSALVALFGFTGQFYVPYKILKGALGRWVLDGIKSPLWFFQRCDTVVLRLVALTGLCQIFSTHAGDELRKEAEADYFVMTHRKSNMVSFMDNVTTEIRDLIHAKITTVEGDVDKHELEDAVLHAVDKVRSAVAAGQGEIDKAVGTGNSIVVECESELDKAVGQVGLRVAMGAATEMIKSPRNGMSLLRSAVTPSELKSEEEKKEAVLSTRSKLQSVIEAGEREILEMAGNATLRDGSLIADQIQVLFSTVVDKIIKVGEQRLNKAGKNVFPDDDSRSDDDTSSSDDDVIRDCNFGFNRMSERMWCFCSAILCLSRVLLLYAAMVLVVATFDGEYGQCVVSLGALYAVFDLDRKLLQADYTKRMAYRNQIVQRTQRIRGFDPWWFMSTMSAAKQSLVLVTPLAIVVIVLAAWRDCETGEVIGGNPWDVHRGGPQRIILDTSS